MSFISRCYNVARNPFSIIGDIFCFCFCLCLNSIVLLGLGSIRTATKRAGGTVHNHGGSPGKRLGVKKFSGAFQM